MKKLLISQCQFQLQSHIFFIQCARSPCFYFIYIYCGDILKQKCGFSANQVINQNFCVSLV
ncbi:MAG: hypothetical protein ACEY3C_04860, partial [Candidatus Tisiphia sp.]